ncbi:hypothetical protein CCP3SC15_640011 [Gammaproteobacteria bacterium]
MEQIQHGMKHYRAHSPEVKALLYDLYLRHHLESPNMSYTMDDYVRESRQRVISHLSQEEMEEILKRFAPEERLRGLQPEERLRGLNPEDIQKLKDVLNKLN